jgi:hypothetical protein
MGQCCTQLERVVGTFSPLSGTFPKGLEIIPDEIFLNICKMLNIKSVEAVARTCKRFRSIMKSDKIPLMYIIYTASDNEALNGYVRNLEYPLELICSDLKLLPRPKLNLAVQRGEIKRSPGFHEKALLWIHKDMVTNEALEAFQKSVSECPDASILLLKGDLVVFPSDLPSVKQPGSVVSWKYLCISGGGLSAGWSGFINEIEGLQWVYFKPGESSDDEATWTMSILD